MLPKKTGLYSFYFTQLLEIFLRIEAGGQNINVRAASFLCHFHGPGNELLAQQTHSSRSSSHCQRMPVVEFSGLRQILKGIGFSILHRVQKLEGHSKFDELLLRECTSMRGVQPSIVNPDPH